MWPIKILRYLLPIFCIAFFGQIFFVLLTIFECQNGKSYISSKLACREGSIYLYFMPNNIISIVLFFLLSLITNTLYYNSIFIKSKSDALQKTNPVPDITLFFTKSIIILLLQTMK